MITPPVTTPSETPPHPSPDVGSPTSGTWVSLQSQVQRLRQMMAQLARDVRQRDRLLQQQRRHNRTLTSLITQSGPVDYSQRIGLMIEGGPKRMARPRGPRRSRRPRAPSNYDSDTSLLGALGSVPEDETASQRLQVPPNRAHLPLSTPSDAGSELLLPANVSQASTGTPPPGDIHPNELDPRSQPLQVGPHQVPPLPVHQVPSFLNLF